MHLLKHLMTLPGYTKGFILPPVPWETSSRSMSYPESPIPRLRKGQPEADNPHTRANPGVLSKKPGQ